MSPPRPPRARRRDYPVRLELPTRWSDNDMYGHVNNVAYYSFFDTAVNQHLLACGALDAQAGEVIGLVVESQCQYFAALSFPEPVTVGLRVGHRGRSSVRYELSVFGPHDDEAAASGHFVHVYVDRHTRRPVAALPEALSTALQALTPPFTSGEPKPQENP